MTFLFEWVCSSIAQCCSWFDLSFVVGVGVVLFCIAFIYSLSRFHWKA